MHIGVVVFEAEDGIRYLVRSRGLGDVYKRQELAGAAITMAAAVRGGREHIKGVIFHSDRGSTYTRLLYTSDAAAEGAREDLGGRRFI